MKKAFFKKSMALFLTVLMVMSCWVWVAPEKASAATAGNYYVEITWSVSDTKKYSNKFTGTETENGARAGMILYYKTNNGTGTEQKVYWDIGYEDQKGTAYGTFVDASTGAHTNSKTTHTTKCIINGFPTAFYATADSNYFLDGGKYDVTKIVVGKPSTSSLSTATISNKTTLWEGTGRTDTTTEWKWFKITADGTGANGVKTVTETGNDEDYGYASSSTENWKFPTPTTATTYEGKVDNVSVPKSGTADVMTVKVIANDQYGVQMGTPTWSISGSVCGTTGISVSPTSGDSTTVKLTNAANVSGTTDTQTGTYTATWGNAGSLSDTFTITDSYYTATFNYQTQNDDLITSTTKTETREAYHGDSITAPTPPQYYEQDYLKTFSAWDPTYSSTLTKDVTYTATYNSTFVGADYTAVNEAIAAADAIKANYGTDYELKYTLESRAALDSAINSVVTGLGRTQQNVVDGYAAEINAKIAALDPNKFDVIFLDKDGAILLYEKDVEYKEAVTAPTYSATYYDSVNHYTFTGWDTDEYTSVVDDLVIQPVFSAEAHTFTTETVESNCVTKGATKYTCSCGYSYVDGETDYGDHVWEADFTIDLEPTCTVAGSKSIHCSLCDAQKDITAIDPLGHNFTSQSIAVDATCGKIGIMTRVCDDCYFCEHSIIPALEHDYKETVVAPTCTAKGYTEYVCQRANCGHSYRDNYTDVIAHNYGAWETVSDALCGVPGVKKQTCADCGHANIGSIDALQHSVGDWVTVVAATCTGKGYQTKTCSLCNNVIEEQWLAPLGHNYATKTVVAPTCTANGYTLEECDRTDCGAQRITNETAALNHAWTSTPHEADCTHSAYIEHVCANDASHNYTEYVNGSTALLHDFTGTETVISKATCTTDGKKTVQCTRCDEVNEIVIPKLGHAYGAWVTVKEATNTEDGQCKRTCTNCDDVEELTIPKGGHTWDNGTVSKPATCKETGTIVYKCNAHTDCGITLEVTIPVAQHTIAQRENEATCTVPGSVESYCSVCNAVLSTEEIPVKAHNLVAGEAVAPTCTTSGYTKYTCECGFSYNEYDASKPATGHSYVADETTAADCVNEGTMTYTCACGDSYTETIPATGHSYDSSNVVQAQSCTDAEKTEYRCDCGASYVAITKEAKGHTFGEWTETQAATADKYGIKERSCACGATEIAKVAPIGDHEFTEEITKNPSCTDPGSKTFTCSKHENCAANYTEEIPATGHTQTIVYTAPTCIADGSSKIVCTKCNAVILSEAIPAKGHAYNNVSVTVEAGCTTTGTRKYACDCGESYTESIPAKGHDLVTTVTDAKCGEKGSVVTSCSRCGYSTTTELAQKGHIWKDTFESQTKATCEADGEEVYKCQNCDATNTVVLPKLGHDWGAWVVVPSTNDTEGSISRTCSRGCTESVPIPAGGHKLVVDAANSISATCTAEGKTVYKCENHDDCGIALEVTVPVAQHTIKEEETEATCTSAGSVNVYCTVCAKVFKSTEIPIKAHNLVAGEAVAPTCTTSGYTPYACNDCTFAYNEYDSTKPATGHSLVEGASTADCDTAGTMTLTCENCTYSTTVDVPALGHDYIEDTSAATDATCALPATKTYKCLRCTDSYTVPVGNKATEHTWGAFEVKQSSTNTSIGYQTRKCTVCGQLDVEIIPATGEHNFNIETGDKKAASCTEDGYIVYACSTHIDCGLTSTVTLPKLGHSETLVYTAATCDNAGSTKMVCATCDATIGEEKVIPALGHLWNDGTVTPANCTTEGKIEYTCTRDGCTGTKTTTIQRNYLAHDYVSTILQPSCTKEGSITVKCSREGCPSNPVNEKLAKKEHNWGTAVVEDPTCVADGSETYTCQDCGATNVVVLPKLGHTWGDWYVSKQSTNTDKGELKRECTVDDCTASEAIEFPAGGHSLVVDVDNSNDATCTAEGNIAYKCENHTDCGITLSVTTAKKQHELVKTEKMATCEADGSVVTKCKNCDTATFTTVIPKTGHSYVGEITKNASCTEEGVMTYTCAHDSNHSYTVAIAKTQHNYQAGEAVAPTCKNSGYTPYLCADCGSNYVLITAPAKGHTYVASASGATCTAGGTITFTCACGEDSFTTDVPALGHDYVLSTTTDATCAAAATETYKCSRCTDNYTVSVGTKTDAHDWNAWVTVEEATYTSLGYKTRTCKICDKLEVATIAATGDHNLTEVSRDNATCEAKGTIYYECSVHDDCGVTDTVEIPALGHTEVLAYTAATCTAKGSAVMYCDNCKKTLDSKEIPMLGHTWANEQITLSTCKVGGKVQFSCECGETKTIDLPVNPNAHQYNTVTEPASCKAEGSVVTKCTLCGDEEANTVLPKLQHTWGEWSVQTPATNTTEGVMIRVCGGGCTETAKFPAGGHAFADTPDEIVSASCTATGTATYKCTAHADCGVAITVTLDKVQHTLDKEIKNATCTEKGFVKVYCTECYKEFANIETEKIAHVFEVISETDPTCTSSGYKTYKCKSCSETYDVISGDANTHAYKVVEGTSTATCTAGGKVTLKCDCGATMEADVVALGHDYQLESETTATCAAAATETYKCSRCTASYTISVGDKTDAHSFADWVVVEQPDYTSIGYKTRTCNICGKLEVETIPATGDHVLVEKSRDNATCTVAGTIYFVCSTHTDCGVTDEVTIPATGHSEKLEYKAPNCTDAGYSKRICTVCDEVLETIEISATGHAFNDITVTKQPSCLDEGEITYTCACGETKTETISASGHALTTVTTDAKCEEEGSVIVSCSKCTYTETTVLAAKGHIWADTPASTSDPTCTADGSKTYNCTNCDKTNTVVVPKLGHSYEAGTAVAPTCTTSGYTPFSCEECGGSYNVYDASSPATGHDFEEKASVAAKCTENGSVTYKCKNCTEEKTEITPKLGHDWGEWSITTQPTATTEGVKSRKCSRGCEETVTLPKLGHEMVKDADKSTAPTCTTDGEDVFKCNTHADCGYTFTVKVAALGHSFDAGIETSAPTCENDGEMTYTCACGETKTAPVPKTGHELATTLTPAKCEENGKVETNCTKCSYGITTVITATGHNITVTTTPATCTQTGSVTEKCTKCSSYSKTTVVEKLAHDYSGTETVVTEATCTEDGEKTIECKYCDATISAIIPHLGHVWGAWTETAYGEMKRTCSRGTCTETVSIPSGGHVIAEEGVITQKPTCKEEGKMVLFCEAHTTCGVSVEITLNKLQHTVSLEKVEATCDTAGTVRAYCSDCGETLSTITTGIGQHKWDAGTPVAPTCTTSGYTLYKCQENDTHVYKEYDETKPALGHSDKAPHDGICDECSEVLCEHKNTKTQIENEVANTCTKDGSYDKIVICTDCYCVISFESVTVSATGNHVFENYVSDGNAVCGKEGTKTAECIYGCGTTDTITDIGSAKQHKWSDWKVAQNRSCTSYEILTSICSLCGETKVEENFKKGLAPHSFVIVEGKTATCLAPGATDYTHCVVCGLVEGSNVLPQLDHRDLDGNGNCDMCDGAYFGKDNTEVCNCMCHSSSGFMQFIYKFIRFFWKLFGTNRSCECGTTHY